jgi:sterol desaturase/sphingolipid hydroxylase (fatty acid hydroxylase superfamily)
MMLAMTVVAGLVGVLAPLGMLLVDYFSYRGRRKRWDIDFPKPGEPLKPENSAWRPEYYRPANMLALCAVLVVFAATMLFVTHVLHNLSANPQYAQLGLCAIVIVVSAFAVWAIARVVRPD